MIAFAALLMLATGGALFGGRGEPPPAPAGTVEGAPAPALPAASAPAPSEAPERSHPAEVPAAGRTAASALADRNPDAEVPAPVPLEKLLRVPAPEASVEPGLEVDRNPHLREPGAEAPPDGRSLRDHVRVERRTERAGIPGPRETTTDRTDASVRLAVQGSVDLRGGVRVDSRRHGDAEREELEATPNVGIDVRF